MTTSRRTVVALAAVVLAVAITGCSGGSLGYSRATEGNFLAACNPEKDGARDTVCRCAFDEIKQHYSYDEFVDLDHRLQADRNDISKELVTLVAACAAPGSTSSSGSSSS